MQNTVIGRKDRLLSFTQGDLDDALKATALVVTSDTLTEEEGTDALQALALLRKVNRSIKERTNA